nr:MAG TPA: hypothetical protein [Caudoviricetes sp.]
MRIAGVYASAFLLFGRKKNIFLIFRTAVNVHKREIKIFYFVSTKTRNSNESHPGIYFRIGVSPQDKNKFIHKHSKLKEQ